jgi:hypothetical protein
VTEVAEGGAISVTNTGTVAHNLSIEGTGLKSPDLASGETATLQLAGLAPGAYQILCEIAGHAQAGMTGAFTIVGAGDTGDTTDTGATGDAAAAMGMTAEEHAAMGAAGDGGMTAAEAAAMDQAMVDSVLAFPAATAGKGNQPLAPTILADGTKHFDLTASIIDWEVSPGEVVKAWAYNGQVPGPRIDVEVGDTVELQLTNEFPVGTDIHWHGIDVPFDQDGVAPITQELVPSGGTYTYRFTTTEAAIGMYHAHAHGEVAVPNGAFGTFYVGEIAPPARNGSIALPGVLVGGTSHTTRAPQPPMSAT